MKPGNQPGGTPGQVPIPAEEFFFWEIRRPLKPASSLQKGRFYLK